MICHFPKKISKSYGIFLAASGFVTYADNHGIVALPMVFEGCNPCVCFMNRSGSMEHVFGHRHLNGVLVGKEGFSDERAALGAAAEDEIFFS